MSRTKKHNDAELINKAIAMIKKAMKGMKRHNGVTPLHHHSLIVYLILRDIFCVHDAEVLVTGILHDGPEDTELDMPEIEREFSTAVMVRVGRQTHAAVSESIVPDKNRRRIIRYRKKLARVSTWDIADCLVSVADILSNLFEADGTVDFIMLKKPPYWNWALHKMIPALEQRLNQLGWPGRKPSSLVTRACRYCGPLPLFNQAELERLDAIE